LQVPTLYCLSYRKDASTFFQLTFFHCMSLVNPDRRFFLMPVSKSGP